MDQELLKRLGKEHCALCGRGPKPPGYWLELQQDPLVPGQWICGACGSKTELRKAQKCIAELEAKLAEADSANGALMAMRDRAENKVKELQKRVLELESERKLEADGSEDLNRAETAFALVAGLRAKVKELEAALDEKQKQRRMSD